MVQEVTLLVCLVNGTMVVMLAMMRYVPYTVTRYVRESGVSARWDFARVRSEGD